MAEGETQIVRDSSIGFLGGSHDHHYGLGSSVSPAFSGGEHRHFYPGRGVQLARLGERAAEGTLVAPHALRPSFLLDPKHALVPFLETDAFRSLSSWLSSAPSRAAQMVVGVGGAGKTRTVLELVSRSAGTGWHCWSAEPGQACGGQEPTALSADPGSDHLVVVDYADRWSRSELDALIRSIQTGSGRVKLVLTSRDLSPWPIFQRALDDAGFVCSVQEVPPGFSPEDADAFYRESVLCFGSVLGVEVQVNPIVWESDALPLTVLAAGLLRVLEHADQPSPKQPLGQAPSWANVSSRLLTRELDHWIQLSQDALVRSSSDPRELHMASVIAALVGPVEFDDATRLLTQVGVQSPDRLVLDHQRACPGRSPKEYLVPLAPDRLAEDLVGGSLAGGSTASALRGWGGQHIDAAVDRLFEAIFSGAIAAKDPERYPDPSLRWAMRRLLEASSRWEYLLDALACQIARRPTLTAIAGSTVLLAISSRLDLDSLIDVSDALYESSSGDLNLDVYPGDVQVSERIVGHPEFAGLPVARRVDELVRLANVLKNVGRLTEASAWAVQAGELIRAELTWEDDPKFSLDGEPGRLSSCGNLTSPRETALALAVIADVAGACGNHAECEQYLAVALSVHGAQEDPGSRGEDLAYLTILQAVARHFGDVGDVGSAVLVEKMLYDRQFALYLKDPAPNRLPRLSVSANNLGVWMVDIGMTEEGLALLRQSVEMRRQQVAEEPWSWLPALTESLHNLAYSLVKLEFQAEALPIASEAVELRRALAESKGQPFVAGLGRSLTVLLKAASALEYADETEAALREVAALARKALDPETTGIIRWAACTYPSALWDWGRRDAAVSVLRELATQATGTEVPTIVALATVILAWHTCETSDFESAGTIVRVGSACFSQCDVSQIQPSLALRLAVVLRQAAQDWGSMLDLLLLISRDANGLFERLDAEERGWLATVLGGDFARMVDARGGAVFELAANLAVAGGGLTEDCRDKASMGAFFHNSGSSALYEDPALAVRCCSLAVELLGALPSTTDIEVSNHSAALSSLSCALRATGSPDLLARALQTAERAVEVAMSTPRRTLNWASNLSMCYGNLALALEAYGYHADAEAAAGGALWPRVVCVEVAGLAYVEELALAWTLYAGVVGFDPGSPVSSMPAQAAGIYSEIQA